MPDAREYRAAARQAQDAYESLGAGVPRAEAFIDMIEFRLLARHLECGHPCPDGCDHCVPPGVARPRARQERLNLARLARRLRRATPRLTPRWARGEKHRDQ
jgi:hypothetical protein